MPVSFFLVDNNGTRDLKKNKPCFASVQHTHLDNVAKVQYLPFTKFMWSDNTDDFTERTQDMSEFGTDVEPLWACEWWSTLLSLPFFANGILNYQKDHVIAGIPQMFEVSTMLPADRMMIILFFLRAPQENPLVVKAFANLKWGEGVDSRLAMLMSCFLEGAEGQYSVSEYENRENTLISKYAFSTKDVKTLMHNEFSPNFLEKDDKSKQEMFFETNRYYRNDNNRKDALAAYFNRKRARSVNTGNLNMTIKRVFGEKNTPSWASRYYIEDNKIPQVIGFFKGIAA